MTTTNTFRATVRGGRIETTRPLDLPDGTELRITVANSTSDEDDYDTSPEGIAVWLTWLASLQPLVRSEQEEHEAKEWEHRCDRYEIDKQNRDIEELFQ